MRRLPATRNLSTGDHLDDRVNQVRTLITDRFGGYYGLATPVITQADLRGGEGSSVESSALDPTTELAYVGGYEGK